MTCERSAERSTSLRVSGWVHTHSAKPKFIVPSVSGLLVFLAGQNLTHYVIEPQRTTPPTTDSASLASAGDKCTVSSWMVFNTATVTQTRPRERKKKSGGCQRRQAHRGHNGASG